LVKVNSYTTLAFSQRSQRKATFLQRTDKLLGIQMGENNK
jgi:hypothetical protein